MKNLGKRLSRNEIKSVNGGGGYSPCIFQKPCVFDFDCFFTCYCSTLWRRCEAK
ncbi:hypothetical protein [Chitinophaga nivalis]|uniref:Bacteriocin n=1 Tax=Chitinophaga nivalis TaxID=2991709 RepID=A0ABT3IKF5_9BACT|nr:hypothetical protein [Chitinophaga nivalis]MCW3465882.1 hypothetical protein [Chitinophaga nivalis]MCW3484427.1 hypothetical protein [Chitinophaga nivalis]